MMPARKRTPTKSLSQPAKRALKVLVERQGVQRVAEREGVTVRTVQRWAAKGPPKGRLKGVTAAYNRSERSKRAAATRSVPRLRQALAEAAVDHSQARYLHNKGLIGDRAYNRVARHYELAHQKLQRNKREGGLLLTRVQSLTLRGEELVGASEVADDFDLSSVRQVYTLFFSGP